MSRNKKKNRMHVSGHSPDKVLALRNVHLNTIMAPQGGLGTNELSPLPVCHDNTLCQWNNMQERKMCIVLSLMYHYYSFIYF